MKMRLAKSYTSFHAIPHGKQDGNETVACRWHQRSRFLWHLVFQDIKMFLGLYHNQPSISYAARRFGGSRNRIPLVSWNLPHGGFIISSIVWRSRLWNFSRPTRLTMSQVMIIMLLLFCCMIVEYHDYLREFIRIQIIWDTFLPDRVHFKCIACMLCYNLLLSVFAASAQFAFGPIRGPH